MCHCAMFVHLKVLINHPLLQEDEKLLWLWLATRSTNNPSLSCSINYEQISAAVNKPLKQVHRILFRLSIMGFLKGDIPIWYGVPTKEMSQQVRHLMLVSQPEKTINKETFYPRVLARTNALQPKALNLLYGRYQVKPCKVDKSVFKTMIGVIAAYPFARKKIWRSLFNLYNNSKEYLF